MLSLPFRYLSSASSLDGRGDGSVVVLLVAETRLAVSLVLTTYEGLFFDGPSRGRSNGVFGILNLSTLAPADTFVAMRTG